MWADKNINDGMMSKQGAYEKLNTLEDVFDMRTYKCEICTFPRFVIHSLSVHPEASFDKIDVHCLLRKMETTQV